LVFTAYLGSAASFIVMMLPPTSSRKAVRLRNASAIISISEIYGFLISTWIGTQTHQKKTLAAPATWLEDFRVKLIGLADQVQTVKQMTELAKWEGNIRGKWPIDEYQALIEAEMQMIGGLAQVLIPVTHF
jgi:Aromatic acid exporter family member 2